MRRAALVCPGSSPVAGTETGDGSSQPRRRNSIPLERTQGVRGHHPLLTAARLIIYRVFVEGDLHAPREGDFVTLMNQPLGVCLA